jgi:hypothetical protein
MDTRMPLPHEIPTFAPKKNGFDTFPPRFRLWECISYLGEGNARMGGWTDIQYIDRRSDRRKLWQSNTAG